MNAFVTLSVSAKKSMWKELRSTESYKKKNAGCALSKKKRNEKKKRRRNESWKERRSVKKRLIGKRSERINDRKHGVDRERDAVRHPQAVAAAVEAAGVTLPLLRDQGLIHRRRDRDPVQSHRARLTARIRLGLPTQIVPHGILLR